MMLLLSIEAAVDDADGCDCVCDCDGFQVLSIVDL